jgi:hypothetical protein
MMILWHPLLSSSNSSFSSHLFYYQQYAFTSSLDSSSPLSSLLIPSFSQIKHIYEFHVPSVRVSQILRKILPLGQEPLHLHFPTQWDALSIS